MEKYGPKEQVVKAIFEVLTFEYDCTVDDLLYKNWENLEINPSLETAYLLERYLEGNVNELFDINLLNIHRYTGLEVKMQLNEEYFNKMWHLMYEIEKRLRPEIVYAEDIVKETKEMGYDKAVETFLRDVKSSVISLSEYVLPNPNNPESTIEDIKMGNTRNVADGIGRLIIDIERLTYALNIREDVNAAKLRTILKDPSIVSMKLAEQDLFYVRYSDVMH